MPTHEDPGCFCKFCCAPCAVYQAQGVVMPDMLLACIFGCFYTMTVWDPKSSGMGAPVDVEMAR